MPKYTVAVVKADKDAIGPAVERVVGLLGGMARFVKRGDLVAIKPNEFTPGTAESGRITHPQVVIEVARLCHELGARVVVIERTPNLVGNFRPYPDIYKYAELLCMDDAPHKPRILPGARSLRDEVDWADIIDQCDVFINIPGLRTHALTRLSNGMKNLMGLLPRSSTFRVHMYGLEGSIVDLNVARPSDLVITDAIYSLEGNFPAQGTPVYTGFLTAADNVVAADLVAAKVLGVDPKETRFLGEAHERGLGPASLEEIELVGDDLEAIMKGFTITPAPSASDLMDKLSSRYRIYADEACAACKQALAGGIIAAESYMPELLKEMPDIAFVCGPQPEGLHVEGEWVLYYGNCVYSRNRQGTQIPGCPPLSGYVVRGLREMVRRRPRTAMCSIAWRTSPIQEVIPIVAEAGYDGIELWMDHIRRFLQEGGTLAQLKALIADAGLAVPMVSPYFNFLQDMEGSLATGREAVNYAVALGAPLVRVFIRGGASAQADHAVWETTVRGLRAVCDIAATQGIELAIETHQDTLHDTTATTLRLILQVGAPNLGVNLDAFNLFDMGEDPVQALRRLMPWIKIMHLKNGRYVDGKREIGIPLAEGAMDYGPFLREVAAQNYGGYASIEWFGPDPATAARSELAYLRQHWGRGKRPSAGG